MGKVERILPEPRVRDAEASLREVVGQGAPCLVIRVDHQEKRVVSLWG